LKNVKVISFNFKKLALDKIGLLHVEPANQKERLLALKNSLKLDELLYLTTCNRIEFILVATVFEIDLVSSLISCLYPSLSCEQNTEIHNAAEVFDGVEAVAHLLRVSSSIDSMVVGEREIITQVRNAYEQCLKMGLTGDFIRILMRNNIETAKKVYTETSIATKPVSIVSLAHHKLKTLSIPTNTRILFVGAGATNTTMCRLLVKHGFRHFTFFNRTLENARKMADTFGGEYYALDQLGAYRGEFDAIVTCTGAEGFVITQALYCQLIQDDKRKKIIIDLAVPCDFDPEIAQRHNVKHISVEHLREISKKNQEERSKEILHVEAIIQSELEKFIEQHRTRQVEIAMREVPAVVKEIRFNAVEHVFAQEISELDVKSKEVLEKVMDFMEKKYISIPMKMAKRILVESAHKN
jgi:glutamyl-tRNA reductase